VISDGMSDVGERLSGHHDLGHLKGHIAAVSDDFRVDLDQLLTQAALQARDFLMRLLTRICPSLASAQSRAARLHTVPIAV
jgi:hypothetical protein